MTTLIIQANDLLTTNNYGEPTYLLTNIFYAGVEQSLPIYLKNKLPENTLHSNSVIAIKGSLREEVRPFSLTLLDAVQVNIPDEDDWLGYITQYLLARGIPTFLVSEYKDGYLISILLENYYAWFNISKDRQVLKKAEFGRWLPLENSNYVRKTSSWTKGIFTNANDYFIEFLQTSWDGEENENILYYFLKKAREEWLHSWQYHLT